MPPELLILRSTWRKPRLLKNCGYVVYVLGWVSDLMLEKWKELGGGRGSLVIGLRKEGGEENIARSHTKNRLQGILYMIN